MSKRTKQRFHKARLALVGLVTSTLLISGCGLLKPTDISGLAEDAPEPGSKVIRLANVYEANHPSNRCGTATMKSELAKHHIDLKVYPASQLGSEAEIVEQVATGALDIGISSGAFFGVWYQDAAVVDGPFLVSDSREYDRMTRGQVMTKLYDEMAAETGLRVFSSWYYGARNMTANKPIRVPDDLKGLKIRVPNAPLYLDMIRTFGGTGTPMALSEVYLGLQQRAIDAEENPIPTIASNKFQEVQSTVSLTRHMVQGVQLVTSERFLNGLSDEQRNAIFDAADKARLENLKCVEAEESSILKEWQDTGAINVVTDVDVNQVRQRIKDQLIPKEPWGDIYLQIQQEIAAKEPTVVGTDPEDSPIFASDGGGDNVSG